MNTQALFCLSLPLVIAGCAQQTSTSTARDSAFAQSLRPPAFSDIYQRSPEVTRSGRYTLVSVKSADAQREPLNQLIDITMPGQVTSAQLRFARVAGVSNPVRKYGTGVLSLAALLGGVVWWNRLPEPPAAPVVPALPAPVQDVFKKAPEPVYLPHPWADMPVATDFLNRCQRWRFRVPVSLDRWRLERVRCSAEGLETMYQRQPGGTASRFAERVKQVFNRTPVFNLVSGGNEGVVFIPWAKFTLQDESAPDAGTQLMQAVSWFQSRQVSFSLSEVKTPPVMPGNDAGTDGVHRGCVSLCFQGEQGRTDVLITVSGRAQFPQKEDYLSPRWYIDVADMVDAMYLVLWLGTLGEGSPTLLISGNEN